MYLGRRVKDTGRPGMDSVREAMAIARDQMLTVWDKTIARNYVDRVRQTIMARRGV